MTFFIVGVVLWGIGIEVAMLMPDYQRGADRFQWRLAGWGIIGLLGPLWGMALLPTLICWLMKFLNRKLAWICLLGLWGWGMYASLASLNLDVRLRNRILDAELYDMIVIETFSMADSFGEGCGGRGSFTGDGQQVKEYLDTHFEYRVNQWDGTGRWRTKHLSIQQESENLFRFEWWQVPGEVIAQRQREREKRR